MKKILTILACFASSIAIVVLLPVLFPSFTFVRVEGTSQDIGMFSQTITSITHTEHTVYKLYSSGELVGILNDTNGLKKHLEQIYHEKYESEYPDTEAHLGKDVYLADERTYYNYSDADEAIFSYLEENSLYSLSCTKVSISEDGEVKAEIYVSDPDLYEEAMNEYISLFADVSSIDNANSSSLSTYGTKDVSVSIAQTITTNDAKADEEEILTTKDEILEFIEYGSETEKEYYTVQAYDTVAGVGAKNYGLSATQVMNINRDKISSTDQILKEGEQLCITYFESPIDVVVYKEALREETIFYDTTYVEDEELAQGEQEVKQEGKNGSRNALYSEKWINGVLTSGTLQSSHETSQPSSEVIALGSKSEPGVGTGSYRYPVNNAMITCEWGCYYGHTGTDFIDQYDRWGDVYAADNGIIEEISYNTISGNYVIINHNNGYKTYYGHMNVPSDLPVGTIVSKGDVIGHIGMTGYATGPHVHFHFYIDGSDEIQDACNYLDCESVPHQ